MFKNKVIIAFLGMFLLVGCGYKQTTTQVRDIGYLKFTKNPSSKFSIVVNDKYEFQLKTCEKDDHGNCYDSTVDKLYEVSSGKVIVKVFDAKNILILKDEFYLGSDNTKEINLP